MAALQQAALGSRPLQRMSSNSHAAKLPWRPAPQALMDRL